jgi:hypothetical protein
MTPQNLTLHNFDTFVSTGGFALVHVQQGSADSDVLQAIAQYFDQVYPGQLVYGTIAWGSVNLASWWKARFAHGREIRTMLDVDSGFYLFHGGQLICHHSGATSSGAGAAFVGVLGLAIANQDLAQRGYNEMQRTKVDAVIGAIEPHVKDSPRARSAKPAPTSVDDPYAVLGIQSSASNDEVRKAYRARLASNHPDRVAHLSPEIQQVAEEQSRRITAAYELIAKARGM